MRLRRRRLAEKTTEKEVSRGSEDEVSPVGVLGGIDSRVAGSRQMEEGLEAGFCRTVARDSEACLPEGGFGTLIRSFESFEGLLGWAWDALKRIRSGMREQLTTAKGIFFDAKGTR